MIDIKEYIESGILELYALGLTSAEETAGVNDMLIKYPELSLELDEILSALVNTNNAKNTPTPSVTIKPFLEAVVNYQDRIMKGEAITVPPILSPTSTISEFSPWINNPTCAIPDDFSQFHAHLIGLNQEAITAIAWIKNMAPEETHNNDYERFLVIEGSCDIFIGEAKHTLNVGDYFEIPLHTAHTLIVTSSIPCKVVLQRVAA